MKPKERGAIRIGKFLRFPLPTYDDTASLLFLSILVGFLGGFCSVGFRGLISLAQGAFFGSFSERVLETLIGLPWYQRLLAPAFGGLLVGLLVDKIFTEAAEPGVTGVIEASVLRGGLIRPRVIISRALTSALTIGSGGSAGREGPVVQIGAGVGSLVGRLLRLPGQNIRTLVGSGAAAGIAAAFNAPIAGSLFSLEVILGDFGLVVFGPIVMAAVAATVVSRAFYGAYPAFQVPPFDFAGFFEIPLYALLGILAGVVGVIFIVLHYRAETWFNSIPLSRPFKVALGGLGVGIIGVFLPQVMGVGYGSIDTALGIGGRLTLGLMLFAVAAKIIATTLTLASGGSGGDLVPSLFIGAMVGGSFGTVMHILFPGQTGAVSAYALIGMGAVFAGVVQAPLTAILIIFELTGDYRSVLPLMVACTISTVLASRLAKGSIYTVGLRRRGILTKAGRELSVLRSIMVREVMTDRVEFIREETSLANLLPKVISSREAYFPVVDKNNEMTGILSFQDLKNVLLEDGLEQLVVAKDLATTDRILAISPHDTLEAAFERFNTKNLATLPVVDPNNHRRVIGMLHRRDAFAAYHRAILQREMEER